MPRLARPVLAAPLLAALLLAALLGGLLAGCTGNASFDPAGPCVVNGQAVDGRAPGAYPDLEALVPRSYDGRGPDKLDSGRNCSDENLGTMHGRGIAEVRFAGGLWEVGERSGVSLAVFKADGLTVPILFEFYETGALTASKTDATQTSDITVDGAAGRRLDTLNDESYQTVVVWPGADGTLRVALVGSDIRETVQRSVHEDRVTAALAAFSTGR